MPINGRFLTYFDVIEVSIDEYTHDNNLNLDSVYFAGGCLWGVQEFIKHLPGVVSTEAGCANGTSNNTAGEYDGYAECVQVVFDTDKVALNTLISYFFEIIDPYSINKQGDDVGEKYRTAIYSKQPAHLNIAKDFISTRDDADKK